MEPCPKAPLCLPSNFTWDPQNKQLKVEEGAPRGDITVCKEGLAILDSVKDDYVIVICITGPARTGKSYFLSQFQEGVIFDVGHTTTSMTTGIWIALAPHSVTVNGEVARLVLLDAEGLGSSSTIDHDGSKERWDRKAFTLCALFSSYLIYNSKCVPTCDDLDKLSFMSQFSSSIHGHLSTPGKETESDVDISPYFMWLIRDEGVQPEVDGQKCTWEKFILSSVLSVEADGAKNSKNAIKTAIRRSFQNIDAQAIPSPSVDPEVIQNLLLPEYKDQIYKKFLDRVEEVKNHVLGRAQVKSINGLQITGRKLALYVSSSVIAVNSETDRLHIRTALESLLEAKWNDTLVVTMKKYDCHANQRNFPISSEDVESFHTEESSEVQKAFTEIEASIFDKSSVTQYRNELNLALDKKLDDIRTRNNEESEKLCKEISIKLEESHFTPIVENRDNFTFEELLEGRQNVIEEYLLEAKGPSIDKVMKAMKERMDWKIKTLQPVLIQKTKETIEEECERALDKIEKRLPLEKDDVVAEYQPILELCVNKFQKRCRGFNGFQNALSKLEKGLSVRFQSLQQKNLNLSTDACEKLMKSSMYKYFDELWILLSERNITDLQTAKEHVLAEYERDARGPAKEEVKMEYGKKMDQQLCPAKELIVQHALTEAKNDFNRQLDKHLEVGPFDSQDASEKCSSSWTTVRTRFDTRCYGLDDELRSKYNETVNMIQSDAVTHFHRRNDKLSSEHCEELMTVLIRDILQPSIDNVEIFVSYDEKKNSILQQYDERAKGPKADMVKNAAVIRIEKAIESAKTRRVMSGITTGLNIAGIFAPQIGGDLTKVACSTATVAAKLGSMAMQNTKL